MKTLRYRLYTESLPHAADTVALYFDGATIYSGVGLWKSKQEPCTVIEILADSESSKVWDLAQALKYLGHQESVLVTRDVVDRWEV